MRLYLDTADREVAEPLLATGLFAGVTTNPTILQRAGLGVHDIPDIHRWARAAGAEEVFFQSWGTDVETLVAHAEPLADLGPDVVLKFVASRAGSSACRVFATRGRRTLLTAVYDPGQAMIAAAAGATYIAPYLGRLNSSGRDGIAEVAAMHEILTATGSPTKVLLASVRTVSDMVALAQRGVDCFTVAPTVADRVFEDPTTAAAAEVFEEAVRQTARVAPLR